MSEEKLTQINYHGSFEFASHKENSRKNGAFLLLFHCRPHHIAIVALWLNPFLPCIATP